MNPSRHVPLGSTNMKDGILQSIHFKKIYFSASYYMSMTSLIYVSKSTGNDIRLFSLQCRLDTLIQYSLVTMGDPSEDAHSIQLPSKTLILSLSLPHSSSANAMTQAVTPDPQVVIISFS